MPRASNVAIDKTFVGGRISQATGLNYPENSCVDEMNCVFDERGFVRRRYGIDYESAFEQKTIDSNDKAISSFIWRNAAGDGTMDLVVVQIGSTLHFYKASNSVSLSFGAIIDTVDLSAFTPLESPGGTVESNECTYASGLVYLFVFHPFLDPIYIVYTKATDQVDATRINVQIRDLEGLNDSLAVDNRPGSLSASHNYNLLNQGWDAAKITTWNSSQSNFPSNADVWWLFRNATTDVFDPSVQGSFNRGNSPAPRGHYILNAFNQDRSTTSGLSVGASVTTSGQRPAVGAFFAGRVFYSGINSGNFTTKILFTQIIETVEEFDQCFQEADPSSETLFELQPTDGGIINIPEAGNIYKLQPFGDYLLVFGYNGVWAITGSQGIGFTADDYSVSLIDRIRSINHTSFVDINGVPVWWNLNGIYTLGTDDKGALVIKSLTDTTIKDYFTTIPFLSKRQARGTYNQLTHIIQWLYRTTEATDPNSIYSYDRILNYNTLTGAFYTWSIPIGNYPIVHSIQTCDTGGSFALNANIVVDEFAVTVVDQFGETVVDFGLGSSANLATSMLTKYLVSDGDEFTWAESVSGNGYVDWLTASSPGTEYDSFLVTGYKTPTQGVSNFQTNYLFVFSEAPEQQKYNVQSQWNFANSGNSGKWSSNQLVNITPTNYDFFRRKLLMRGNGHALSLKFSSVGDVGFNLIGWSMYQTSNSVP